jgi:hypothetical protein
MKRGGQPVNDRSSTQRVDTLEEALKLFEAWRTHRKKTGRIPEELWAAAVQACWEHSIHKVSRTLRLSYSDLKARIEQVPSPSESEHDKRWKPRPEFSRYVMYIQGTPPELPFAHKSMDESPSLTDFAHFTLIDVPDHVKSMG